MSIELHIERLVIDEALLQGERPAAVLAAMESELVRLLGQPGATDALQRIGNVTGLPVVPIAPGSLAHGQLGMRLARSIGQSVELSAAPNRKVASRGVRGPGESHG